MMNARVWQNLKRYRSPNRCRGGSSLRATLFLAGWAVLCLLAAQALVMARSDQVRARENAADLVEQVSEDGLDTYLISEPTTLFYVIEENERIIGYAIYSLAPETDEEGSVSYTGRELYRELVSDYLSKSRYSIRNDLSAFVYELQLQENRNAQTIRFHFADLQLRRVITTPRGPLELPPMTLTQRHYVPPFLIDFFSSLAVKENPKNGALFMTNRLGFIQSLEEISLSYQCWVQPGQRVPSEMIAKYPNGRKAQTRWPLTELIQDIYYSQDHLLLWQRNRPDGNRDALVMRVIDREELFRLYPEARQILQTWQRQSQTDPSTPED